MFRESEKELQKEHSSMHLWSAFLSFIFIIYSVKKGKPFCFYWTSADLYIILNTTYFPLDIFVIMRLTSVIEFMLFWGIGGYGARFLVLWVIGKPDIYFGGSAEDCVTKKTLAWSPEAEDFWSDFHIIYAKRKFISGLVKEGRWLDSHSPKACNLYVDVLAKRCFAFI